MQQVEPHSKNRLNYLSTKYKYIGTHAHFYKVLHLDTHAFTHT